MGSGRELLRFMHIVNGGGIRRVAEYMTPKEAAIFIRRSYRAVRHLYQSGRLTPLRAADGKILLSKEELERFVKGKSGQIRLIQSPYSAVR